MSLDILIQEAREKCGFSYLTTAATVRANGYQLLDCTPNYKNRSMIDTLAGLDMQRVPVESLRNKHEDGKDIPDSNQLGAHEAVIWYDEFGEAPVAEFIKSGSSERAAHLIYAACRKGGDHVGRPGTVIYWGMHGPKGLINDIVTELKQSPEMVGALFAGIFPDLESKYSVNSNGKVVIVDDCQNITKLSDAEIKENTFTYEDK